MAQRVYELFLAWDLASLYTVEYVCPTRLVQMTDAEFYNYVMPSQNNLRKSRCTVITEGRSLYVKLNLADIVQDYNSSAGLLQECDAHAGKAFILALHSDKSDVQST